jgi:hypothetical protein
MPARRAGVCHGDQGALPTDGVCWQDRAERWTTCNARSPAAPAARIWCGRTMGQWRSPARLRVISASNDSTSAVEHSASVSREG